MPQVTLDMSAQEIKALVLQLPVPEFLALLNEMEERVETVAMMRLAETSFAEWNDPEEALYDA